MFDKAAASTRINKDIYPKATSVKQDIIILNFSFAQHLIIIISTDSRRNYKLLHNCKKGVYMNATEEYERGTTAQL